MIRVLRVAVRVTVGVITVASAALAVIAVSLGMDTHSAPATVTRSGVFEGFDAAEVQAFEEWRSRKVDIVLAYMNKETWEKIEGGPGWIRYWSESKYRDRMLITVPMLPTGDPSVSLAVGATGAYNKHFNETARNLVAAGMGNATLRIGHELNGNWYPWAAEYEPEAYAEFYRQIVTTMRSVPGQSFSFDWNVSAANTRWDATTAYPGDAYVDTIGQDVYDKMWADSTATPEERWSALVNPTRGSRQGLKFWADFAAAHNKAISFAEWGLVGEDPEVANGGGGGDDPYMIEQMHNWIATHNTAFEVYFDKDTPTKSHELLNGQFPQAAETYRRLFGGGT